MLKVTEAENNLASSSVHNSARVLSGVRLFASPWPVAHQPPLFVGFSPQESWSGLPFPAPGDLPDPGTEPECLVSPSLAARFFTTEPPGKPNLMWRGQQIHPVEIFYFSVFIALGCGHVTYFWPLKCKQESYIERGPGRE